MITTKRKTIISPRRVQLASSIRIPQNISRSLLTTINITPLKLSSVSSIRLNDASNCNIFRNSLRIRLAPVKSPIIRKYKNLYKFIYIRFGSKLYRQNVGIPMGTNCAPLVADLFLFCYERDFMKSLTKEKRYDLIDAFNSTSRYLDDLLNIDNIHFEHMVHRIYPAELQLNKANASDTEAAFLDLNLSIHNDIVSTKIYDKRDDFNFDIVNFPFLDGDVPQRPSYGVYISQLIRFARASSHVTDFNNRTKFLTAKLLKQGYRYHKLRKAFSKFYRRHFELIEKYHVSLKKLMQQGICNPEFYGDLVYKFKKIIGNPNFSNLLKRIVNRFKRAGYSLDIMRQTACLVFNPIMVEDYAALFSCTAVVQASDSMTASM